MWKSSFSFFLNAKKSTNDPKRKRNSLKSAGYFAREKESWGNGPILRSEELWNWPTFAPRYSIVNIYGYICTGRVSVLVVLARKNGAVQQFTTRSRSFRFCSSPDRIKSESRKRIRECPPYVFQVLTPSSGLLDFAISMRPDYHRAIIDTVRYYGWKKIIYLYDSHDGKSPTFLMHFSFYNVPL